MHDDFLTGRSRNGTEISLTGDLLVKRWEGVEKAAKNPGQEVLDMVRVALGRHGGAAAFLGKFKAAFKEADATFQMSGNDLELSVLAGSTLCWIFNQEADEADEASLALLSAVSIVKGPEWSEAFISHANTPRRTAAQNSESLLRFGKAQLATNKLKQQFEVFAAKLTDNQPPQTSEAAKQPAAALLQAMTTATEATATAIDQLDRQSDLRQTFCGIGPQGSAVTWANFPRSKPRPLPSSPGRNWRTS